jgi:hypothetical protein
VAYLLRPIRRASTHLPFAYGPQEVGTQTYPLLANGSGTCDERIDPSLPPRPVGAYVKIGQVDLDPPHPLSFRANEPLADVRGRFDAMRVDLNWVHLHKTLFWDVVRGLERDSPGTSQLWLGHYLDLYVHSQAVAVRRIVGGPNSGGDSCLYRILKILETNAGTITIERLAAIHAFASTGSRDPGDVKRHANSIELEWGNGKGTLSKANIKKDLSDLKRDTELVTTWATEHVAHLSRRPLSGRLTIGDFDNTIADVVAVFRKYGILLTTTDYAINENVPGLDWWVPLSTLFAGRGPDYLPPEAS